MSTFEVCWSMYGTAKVEAASIEEAVNAASRELHNWSGIGVDLEEVSIDGSDVEP